MKELREETIKVERIFTGKILTLDVETVKLPDGQIGTREVIHHPGAVAILPVDSTGEIFMVRQYRKALEQVLLEIPAGKLEPGEDPMECAKRELAEEIGKKAENWTLLVSVWSAPGFADEKLYIYLAEGLSEYFLAPDEDEFLQVEKYSVERLQSLIRSGEVQDTKTVLALLAAGKISPLV
jgi:NTP pyrophosphohydrolases including oxidative damage repair enzymes